MAWANCVAYPKREAMREPDCGVSRSRDSHVFLYHADALGAASEGHLLECILSGKSYERQYLYVVSMARSIMIINIGEEIREIVKRQGKSITWLAKQINCSRVNIYKIFERSSIDTNTLLRISDALDYDFFAIYSQNLTMNKKQDGEE